jgi:hypothetical protein
VPFLVDGSNLGGRLGGASGARNRVAVLRLLLAWARGGPSVAGKPRPPRRRVLVVFDGPEDPALARAYGPLELRFAGTRPADAVILEQLGGDALNTWVVSGDRALVAACRARGARAIDPDEVLQSAVAPREEPAGSDAPVDVADWEAWFRRGGAQGDEP